MNWKTILAAVIIIGIAGFFFFTDIGSQYTAQIVQYTGKIDVGSLTGFLITQKPAGSFPFVMTAQSSAFLGQDYKVANATVAIDGIYQYINAGSLSLESTSGKQIAVSLQNYNGDFQISAGGSIILKGTASNVMIGDLSASSSKINVQMEVLPSTFSLSSFQQSAIKLYGVTGTIERNSENPDTINLSNNNVTVNYFSGSLSLQQGTATLQGTASSIKGDNFSFV